MPSTWCGRVPNKNYINGRAHEYRVRNEWAAKGYTALRSAGSHSPYDVVAVKPISLTQVETTVSKGVEYTTYITEVTGYAIQCKRRKLAPASGKRTNHHQNP
jgi:hypothetical protein